MALTASPSEAAGREIEGDGDGGKLALVVDGERRVGAAAPVSEGAERHLGAVG